MFEVKIICGQDTLKVIDNRGWASAANPTGISPLVLSATTLEFVVSSYAEDGTLLGTTNFNALPSYTGMPTVPEFSTALSSAVPYSNVYYIEVNLVMNGSLIMGVGSAYYLCRAMDCLAEFVSGEDDCKCGKVGDKKYFEYLMKLFMIQNSTQCISRKDAVELIKEVESLCPSGTT